jgi:hypothetical protein
MKINCVILLNPDVRDLCYTDSTGHRSCYKQMSSGTFDFGLQSCARLGGHLPIIFTRGETTFLMQHFPEYFWIGLTSDKLVI